MLRTFIIQSNTQANPGGRNAGNNDAAFTEINGVIYDNYAFANPEEVSLAPIATAVHPPPLVRAAEYLNSNFYRIFYPEPTDSNVVLNNPWRSPLPVCAQPP